MKKESIKTTHLFLHPSSEKLTRTAAEAPTDALFLLFLVVEAEHKMAPNARCANNGQTDDSLITYSAQDNVTAFL